VLAVDGRNSPDVMHEALRAHKDSRVPLQSIVANEDYVKVVDVAASLGNAFRTCCATRRNPPSWRNLRARKRSARSQNRPRHGRPLKRRKFCRCMQDSVNSQQTPPTSRWFSLTFVYEYELATIVYRFRQIAKSERRSERGISRWGECAGRRTGDL